MFVQDLHRLCLALCRELAERELSATVHARCEARRFGHAPPAEALLAIADHAGDVRPRFEALMAKRRPRGIRFGRTVGEVVSTLRYLVLDRRLDRERSYRSTLLRVQAGVGVVRLLREVALREHDALLVRFCDEWLVDRLSLIERAEQALAWFADERAIRSGFSPALQPGSR